MTWEGLTPPYATIVADPPWDHSDGAPPGQFSRDPTRRHQLGYSTMTVWEIAAMPVTTLAAQHAHLYLWTTNRYLRDAYMVTEAWGFKPAQVLVWCKPPMGIGPGGAFANSTEFILFARRGRAGQLSRQPSSWWQWQRGPHSAKPPAFLDVVEQVSPAPRVELFARAQRLGWDSWGWGYEHTG